MSRQRFEEIIKRAAEEHWSDVHLVGGHPVMYRHSGSLCTVHGVGFSPQQMDELTAQLISEYQADVLLQRWSTDFALSVAGVRLRINIYNTARGLSLAARLLANHPPDFAQLNLHPSLEQLVRAESGLVLVCGATGSGKTTTIAALLEQINLTRPDHIITLEDPIEYRFTPKQALINQRELGAHFPSFERGVLDVLREDPDVVLIGELREAEVVRQAMNLAESGHLVLATLHASSAEEALLRICHNYPESGQSLVRQQLSTSLRSILVQQLKIHPEVGFSVPLLSVLHATASVRALIREGKFAQLPSVMEMGSSEGMFTQASYKKEWFDKLRQPVSPAVMFQAALEDTALPEHTSVLCNQNLTVTHYTGRRNASQSMQKTTADANAAPAAQAASFMADRLGKPSIPTVQGMATALAINGKRRRENEEGRALMLDSGEQISLDEALSSWK